MARDYVQFIAPAHALGVEAAMNITGSR
jgi:hypothetical protein